MGTASIFKPSYASKTPSRGALPARARQVGADLRASKNSAAPNLRILQASHVQYGAVAILFAQQLHRS